uniref:Serum response factor-binding protein 1 n=1 Tax=Glossina morsitans morsitans TaxID=37546 RepID=A0A1B0G9L3_GLOMM
MLNKLKFNNLVIAHKTDIQRVRTQTINKVVNKIRKLKNVLEKRGKDEKNRTRLLKFTETLEHVKKLSRIDIMKNVLTLEKSPKTVLTNGLVSPTELAVALLSLNKVMQMLIKKFKNDLQLLPDKAHAWRKELMQSSKKKQKLERTAEKKRKRQQLKEQKATERKRKEWLEENTQNAETTNANSEVGVSTFGEWKVELIDLDNEKQVVSETERTSKKLKRPFEKTRKELASKKLKSKAESSLTRADANEKEDDFPSSFEEEQDSHTEATHIIDPFFITNAGENYLSTAVVLRNESLEKIDSNKEGDDFQFVKLNKHTKNKLQPPKKKEAHQNTTAVTRKCQKKDPQNTTELESLHPSWAAKKKLKPIINSFQGKRTTFDKNSDGEAANISNLPNEENEQSSNVDLHPSWIAKQKMKPTITAFQGKKIIFDLSDDNDDDK